MPKKHKGSARFSNANEVDFIILFTTLQANFPDNGNTSQE